MFISKPSDQPTDKTATDASRQSCRNGWSFCLDSHTFEETARAISVTSLNRLCWTQRSHERDLRGSVLDRMAFNVTDSITFILNQFVITQTLAIPHRWYVLWNCMAPRTMLDANIICILLPVWQYDCIQTGEWAYYNRTGTTPECSDEEKPGTRKGKKNSNNNSYGSAS